MYIFIHLLYFCPPQPQIGAIVGMQERSVDPVTDEHRFSVFACRRYGIVRRVLMPITCQKGQKLNSITLSFCIIQVTV